MVLPSLYLAVKAKCEHDGTYRSVYESLITSSNTHSFPCLHKRATCVSTQSVHEQCESCVHATNRTRLIVCLPTARWLREVIKTVDRWRGMYLSPSRPGGGGCGGWQGRAAEAPVSAGAAPELLPTAASLASLASRLRTGDRQHSAVYRGLCNQLERKRLS